MPYASPWVSHPKCCTYYENELFHLFMLLSDIPVQILRDITLISVFTRMLSVTWASFMILSVGILLSTLFNHKKHHLFKVFTSLFFLCVLPNILYY